MNALIEARNLIKTYNGVAAVNDISFTVSPGEFFGLLGPNGAGKTTTIRMLYGFSPLSQGRLTLFGQNIATHWRAIKNRIGVCQQDNTLDPDLTVEQNLLIYAGYFLIPAAEARDRAAELLDFFALGHRKDAKVMELSGGMARRLILARALVNRPELLILDEPTTGLDPQSRHQVWEKLAALKKRGLTVLLTTHYMEEAASLCDRLMIIDHGRILVEGAPDDLISRHAGRQVIEIDGADVALRAFVAENGIEMDDLGEKVIVYTPEASDLHRVIQEKFCTERCTFRNGTLEDVFLRLTGRELRE
ncbi:MAG: ABC transporter ATP-binding protein [Desulfobacterales bacterium]|nr:ABC transporter ATP-binding protein [Desulfobacterales bacterium]